MKASNGATQMERALGHRANRRPHGKAAAGISSDQARASGV
ncbi:hypothetical protein AGRO_2499 [Agrobacterium sp. ATCC 31749]|nr:hypothetical protein AGRO_2499 [Agrobacterium sp. ATCC 31749]